MKRDKSSFLTNSSELPQPYVFLDEKPLHITGKNQPLEQVAHKIHFNFFPRILGFSVTP